MGNIVDKITDTVWLGEHVAIHSQHSPKCRVIITALTSEELRKFRVREIIHERGVEWHSFMLDDDENELIEQHFTTVHSIITAAEKEGKPVLVHCAAGISRSSTLVIAHLMQKHRWTYKEAFEYVQKRRPIIQPNDGFIQALKHLEMQILLGDPL